MPQMTTYTVRYKQYVSADEIVQDECIMDSPCEAYNLIERLLMHPTLHSYKIIKEELLSLDELRDDMTTAVEIIKKG